VAINVFENAPSGSFECNNFEDVRPDVAVIFFALSLSCEAEWLAWVSCGEDVTVWNKSFWITC
jgi:hypothetical protein